MRENKRGREKKKISAKGLALSFPFGKEDKRRKTGNKRRQIVRGEQLKDKDKFELSPGCWLPLLTPG